MSARVLLALAGAAALAAAVAACGPYAQVAQKLDVTARVAGDTWIAAGPDRSELRVLVVSKPDANGAAAFSFSSLQMPISRGTAATQLQGTWIEVGNEGAATLQVAHTYALPEESGVPVLQRRGSYRDDVPRTLRITVTRDAGALAVAGDPSLAGTYVPLRETLARVPAASDPASCAFQIANLAIRSSELRIIGFGGAGMLQYSATETFVGTVAGELRVHMDGGLDGSKTTITYDRFEDFGGVAVAGPQITDVGTSANGHMSGVMTFTLSPLGPGGTPAAPLTGSIDYGSDPTDPVQITSGTATGGTYLVRVDGGGSARVAPQTPPSPSVSECLGLP